MFGVLVNAVAVAIGGVAGVVFKKAIPRRIADGIMVALALCVVYLGVSGSLSGENPLIVIGAMVLGAIIGTGLDLDGKLIRFGDKLQAKFAKEGEKVSIAEGFVTASLLYCVGAMAVVGSLNAGLMGDNEMLYTKSVLDGVSAVMLGSGLGIGVVWSAGAVLLYQGIIALAAGVLAPLLTDSAIAEMTCAGSLLILGLGLNMLGITKIKVADYLPAVFIAPILAMIFG